ncbi:MAG: hypothetical protein NWE79_05260 [Candidatus Bathyarchaeota archaeon]|nr:hypothetical protein [Candidatus Bathyarchaeota archaeon]
MIGMRLYGSGGQGVVTGELMLKKTRKITFYMGMTLGGDFPVSLRLNPNNVEGSWGMGKEVTKRCA